MLPPRALEILSVTWLKLLPLPLDTSSDNASNFCALVMSLVPLTNLDRLGLSSSSATPFASDILSMKSSVAFTWASVALVVTFNWRASNAADFSSSAAAIANFAPATARPPKARPTGNKAFLSDVPTLVPALLISANAFSAFLIPRESKSVMIGILIAISF